MPNEYLMLDTQQDEGARDVNAVLIRAMLLKPTGATLLAETTEPLNPIMKSGGNITQVALDTILAGHNWQPCGDTVFLTREIEDSSEREAEYCYIAFHVKEEKAGWFSRKVHCSYSAHRITPTGLSEPIAHSGRCLVQENEQDAKGRSFRAELAAGGWTPVSGTRDRIMVRTQT